MTDQISAVPANPLQLDTPSLLPTQKVVDGNSLVAPDEIRPQNSFNEVMKTLQPQAGLAFPPGQ